ncbi:hypothetical protein [Streptomyces atratus]
MRSPLRGGPLAMTSTSLYAIPRMYVLPPLRTETRRPPSALMFGLRHTGTRIEEMLETSRHALVQYRLPTTGEIVPLLQIAPSKSDQERVLLVSPELADVLAAIVRRVRDPRTGGIPLLAAYDYEERIWNPPAPLLFQWDRAGGHPA